MRHIILVIFFSNNYEGVILFQDLPGPRGVILKIIRQLQGYTITISAFAGFTHGLKVPAKFSLRDVNPHTVATWFVELSLYIYHCFL